MAAPSICSVGGCDNPTKIRGLCNAHNIRFLRHGTPTGGRERMQGEVMAWLKEVAIPYQGEDCLIFPFYRDSHGYGRISDRKGYAFAHQYVAEKVHGPAPSDDHETCHDCGNGHLGCVAGNHVYWGTRSRNMLDRVRHGVFVPPPLLRGTDNPKALVDEDDVREIRLRLSRGCTLREIAEEYGLSISAAHAIKSRKTWAWLD